MRNQGRFITFEGGEGCGKSTQIRLFCEHLQSLGKDVVLVREPGGTPLGEAIRSILKSSGGDEPCDKAELFLFLAARAQLVEKTIKPALEAGRWVLCDRFSDSTIAYQGYGRGLGVEEIVRANSFACSGLKPDLTFLLDLDAECARKRMRRREQSTNTAADRIELAGDAFHGRLRDGFLELSRQEPQRFAVIDASGTPEEVFGRIRNRFDLLGW